MTTYAPGKQTSSIPPAIEIGHPQIRPDREPGRGLVLAAATALLVCAGALIFSAVRLFSPQQAATHVVIMPPAPPAYNASDVAAAKSQACSAWESATQAINEVSNAVAEAPRGWEDPRKKEALGYEARTTLVENAFLESQVSPATPAQVAGLIHDYVVANLDQEEATMRRMGSQVDAAIGRGNAAVDKLNVVCGLS